MAEPVAKVPVSYAEYLVVEAKSEGKHQFANGEICAMAGGTRRHAYLQTRLVGALLNALARSPCVPYGSELRVHLPALGEGTYPDASIVCGDFLSSPLDSEATITRTWRAYTAGERVPLACANAEISVDDIYAGAFDADRS